MANNKIYYHNFKNSKDCIIAESFERCSFIIDSTNGATFISLIDSGYYLSGAELPWLIKFYYNPTDRKYYIVRKGDINTFYNITIQTLETYAHGSGMIQKCSESPDLSGLTLLNKLSNFTALPLQNIQHDIIVTGGTTTVFKSKLPKNQYTPQCSLVFLSLRTTGGSGGSALLLLHRKNESSILDFTIHEIFKDEGLSSFTITPNNEGISFSHTSNYKYFITEIVTQYN